MGSIWWMILLDSLSSRPPSFKQVTPSSRTNVRQLLQREQWLQQEQRNRQSSSLNTANPNATPGRRRGQSQPLTANMPCIDIESSHLYQVIQIIDKICIYIYIYEWIKTVTIKHAFNGIWQDEPNHRKQSSVGSKYPRTAHPMPLPHPDGSEEHNRGVLQRTQVPSDVCKVKMFICRDFLWHQSKSYITIKIHRHVYACK